MAAAIRAAREWGDARAIPALERLVATSPHEFAVRAAREALLALQGGKSRSAEARQLRDDLEALRDENRQLRAHLEVLEASLDGRRTNNRSGRRATGRSARRAGSDGLAEVISAPA
jgi:hypothetical protein